MQWDKKELDTQFTTNVYFWTPNSEILAKALELEHCFSLRWMTLQLSVLIVHLDYCNSLLAGLPISYLSPLQRIQNTAARMITLTRKHDHISPILRSLHWLPVHSRITFKILLFVYKITHNLAPQYLQDLVSLRSSSSARSLRSSSSMQLIHGPRTKTRYGDRAFSFIAPTLWNKLLLHIQNAPSIESF